MQPHTEPTEPAAFADPAPGLPEADGHATDRPGLTPLVFVADCLPVALAGPRGVAMIHCGWRGMAAGIVQHGVEEVEATAAAVGPSIGPCCYEVGTEVATQFLSQFPDAPDYFDEFRTGDEPNPIQWLNMMPPGHQPPPKGVLLDLRKANRSQLQAAGLRPQNIHTIDLCTACRPDLLFSYRKEGPASGRLMSVIALRP
jgi:YfiH family protein